MTAPAPRSQLTQLSPGAYVDEAGVLHLDLPEMCVAAGYPPTEANQQMLQRAAAEMFGGAEFEEVPDDGHGRWRSNQTGDDPDPRGPRAGIV